ncbi:hypothetical protein X985_882 [Burkholderia pseudomallei MSHR4012]|nr:hypothetical protein DO63_1017 [Burkholderia pseudomallei]KGV45734.1 hypothetical protein X985_882 [Burkholderia pseudomallei MSHR4012]
MNGPPTRAPIPPPSSVKKSAIAAAAIATRSAPDHSHATKPTTPPVTTEPASLPNIARDTPPATIVITNSSGSTRPSPPSSPPRARGGGSGSPSITRIMPPTPAETPP